MPRFSNTTSPFRHKSTLIHEQIRHAAWDGDASYVNIAAISCIMARPPIWETDHLRTPWQLEAIHMKDKKSRVQMRRYESYCRPLTQRPAWPRYADSTTGSPEQSMPGRKSSLMQVKTRLTAPICHCLPNATKEFSFLKIIGEYAVANDALKKRWREAKNEWASLMNMSYSPSPCGLAEHQKSMVPCPKYKRHAA